jgi:hypothetical protein
MNITLRGRDENILLVGHNVNAFIIKYTSGKHVSKKLQPILIL